MQDNLTPREQMIWSAAFARYLGLHPADGQLAHVWTLADRAVEAYRDEAARRAIARSEVARG